MALPSPAWHCLQPLITPSPASSIVSCLSYYRHHHNGCVGHEEKEHDHAVTGHLFYDMYKAIYLS